MSTIPTNHHSHYPDVNTLTICRLASATIPGTRRRNSGQRFALKIPSQMEVALQRTQKQYNVGWMDWILLRKLVLLEHLVKCSQKAIGDSEKPKYCWCK